MALKKILSKKDIKGAQRLASFPGGKTQINLPNERNTEKGTHNKTKTLQNLIGRDF